MKQVAKSGREELMAKKGKDGIKKEAPKKTATKIDEYAHIEINKRRAWLIKMAFMASFAYFALLFYQLMSLDQNWLTKLPAVLIAGVLIALIPLAERWIYKPWQKTPQRNEASKMFVPSPDRWRYFK